MILDAAEKRLRDGGPEAVRLQDIAGDVGISHPAILHHFESRAGLVRAMQGRAMEKLEGELLAAIGAAADEGSVAAMLERVFATLGESGQARLLAWNALAGELPEEQGTGEPMLRQLCNALHERRVSLARAGGSAEPTREDSEFVVRLVAVALLGDALWGPILNRSFALEDGTRRQRRFRAWLARLLDTRRLGSGPEDH